MVPARRSILGAPVTGSVDATYQAAWLTDGLPGYPAKTTGDLSLTVTPASALDVDVVAVCHHAIREAAAIALGGSLASTIDTEAWPADDIPHNWFRLLTVPTSVSSIVLGVTGNTDPVIVGELWAGLSTVFPDLLQGRKYTPESPFPWEGEFSSLAPYDPGVSDQRRVSGTVILTDDEFADLEDIRVGQRRGSRPVLWIDDDDVNDAWLAQFSLEEEHSEGLHIVTLEITEIPRTRW